MEGAHVIEVNDLVNSLTSKRNEKKIEFPLLQKIRRMPCDADKDVYEPSIVSIAPYHHKIAATLEMEKTKWKSFKYILELNPKKKMRDYLEALTRLEQQIRSCYANQIEMDSNEFLKMVLLDGCFVLYILFGTEGTAQPIVNLDMSKMDERNRRSEHNDDAPAISISTIDSSEQMSSNNTDNDNSLDETYYSKHWYPIFYAHDLLLLENQVPFFVVTKIYELVTNGMSPIAELLQKVAKLMEDLLSLYPNAPFKFDREKELHHLFYLCHQYFKPRQIYFNNQTNHCLSYDDEAQNIVAVRRLLEIGWHQATEYSKSGIEFKKREVCTDNPHSLLDIVFCEGLMEMPCLTIDTNSYCLFPNLIAFEETFPQFENYITTYVVFLSQFLGAPEDVSLVTKRGIIVHQLDSDAEVSELFKMLAKGVSIDVNGDYYLKHLFHAIEMHHQMHRSRWREWLGSISSKVNGWAQEGKPNRFTEHSV